MASKASRTSKASKASKASRDNSDKNASTANTAGKADRASGASTVIELQGHIIDSLTLPRVWGAIEDAGAHFHVQEMRVGQSELEESYVRLEVSAASAQRLNDLMGELQRIGATPFVERDARLEPAPRDGVLPDDFYSTANLPTFVRVNSDWIEVARIEMDVAIVVDRTCGAARACPMHDVRAGEMVVVGYEGVRIEPLERPRQREAFGFMQSAVSSERAKSLAIADVAEAMRACRARGGKTLFVLGPAIVHTAARQHIASLIRRGYIQVIFGGNAIIAHDVEAAMFGTSLGIDLQTGEGVEHGHRNHLRAINTVRAAGSLEEAHRRGLLGDGIIAAALEQGVEVVLAGSIRDDGPMPGVITDSVQAQGRMREACQGVEVCVLAASMLHAIATTNMLPAAVKCVVVDINPAVVTKLADRGAALAMGLVTDVELFLRELDAAL